MHPDPISHKEERQRCFCRSRKKVKNEDYLGCETCQEWYHKDCLGLSEEEKADLGNWECGYCCAVPDEDEFCEWNRVIPQGNRKRMKKAEKRHISETPKELGLTLDSSDRELVGMSSWADVQSYVAKEGQLLNLKMSKYRKKAATLIKKAGHHIGDTMSGGGLQMRGIDDTLVEDLLSNNILTEDDIT